MEIIAILIIVGIALVVEQQIFVRLVLKNVTYTARFSTSEAMEGETLEIIEEIVNDKGLPVPWVKTELSTSCTRVRHKICAERVFAASKTEMHTHASGGGAETR